ncbi:MAG: cyclic pyranopterin monophosphate synthase MoaC [Candidatus Hydrogenedentota bacterium]
MKLPTKFSHLTKSGDARMVSISNKEKTHRIAISKAEIKINKKTMNLILKNEIPKGDIFSVSRNAGIMAVKKTAEYIILAHPLNITAINIDFNINKKMSIIEVEVRVEAFDRTGVEMESLVGATAACLNLYDMIKSVDKSARINNIRLVYKKGGKSGEYIRPPQL